MGSGKTSVGQCLAKKARKKFYDSDVEIEQRSGVSISWIFEVEKELGFRKREAKVIEDLTRLSNIVLATGGGCVITQSNRECLSHNGIVVYLRVSLPEQVKRTSHRHVIRPLVNVPDPKAVLTQLNKEREPLYQELADLIYDTNHHTPQMIASQIWRDIIEKKEDERTLC